MPADDPFIDGERDEFDPAQAISAEGEVKRLTAEAEKKVVDNLLRRQEAYRRVFSGMATPDDARIVLDDLVFFCRGDSTAWSSDDRVHALLTGRQEVYLRVMDHMRLSFDALLLKYTTPRTEG